MTDRKYISQHSPRAGFTLIELMVVVAIVATVAAMAMPQLMPAIIYSTHDGTARHLANYGRSAIAHATLSQEEIQVNIDLDKQEYWCERWPKPEPVEEEDNLAGEENDLLPEDDDELFRMAQEELGDSDSGRTDEERNDIINEQSNRMAEKFNTRSQQALMSRAGRIVHDQRGLLDDVGDLFEDDFRLDDHGEKIEPEEIDEPLLQRTRLDDGVYIEYVQLGDTIHADGTVKIELSPLGLGTDVLFSLINEDGDVLLVEWDPVRGTARVKQKEDA